MNSPTTSSLIVLKNRQQLQIWRKEHPKDVHFIPTMGNLHKGHLSLIELAGRRAQKGDAIVISLFVNPTQFGEGEDFERYPRTFEEDKKQIESIQILFPELSFVLFSPLSPLEIYPPDFSFEIKETRLSKVLCGKFRPGHFDGVTTVVYLFFSLIHPHNAYFGAKDFQQYLCIKKMVRDLNLDIDIIRGEIIRDEDGLALSSRNQYLSKEQRLAANELPTTLKEIKNLFNDSSLSLDEKKESFHAFRQQKLKATNSPWQYLEALDGDDLSELNENSRHILVAAAFMAGQTRLIDNIYVER